MRLALALLLVSCATARGGPGALATIDVVDGAGHLANLAAFSGKVTAIDLCATWAEACHLNGRALDLARSELPERDVALVTVLLDDLPVEALRAYVGIAQRTTPVLLAGPRTRAGRSVLGDAMGVPRLVVMDRQGRIVLDESGGVLSPQGLVQRLRPLL